MNEAIERINRRLFDLNLQKEESINAFSEWAARNPTKPYYEYAESRVLTRHINKIRSQIRVLEELKAELEEADTLAELDEMIASETN